MQSLCRLLIVLLAGLPLAYTQDVGTGSPNGAISAAFLQSYYRNGFANLVSLPPINNVQKLGTGGYIQEFNDANKTTGVKYALILPNTTGSAGDGQYAVFQAYPAVYAYYSQIGVNTAGYPTADTQTCPPIAGNACTYQFFSKLYVLFAYTSAVNGATTYYTRDPFYTKWQALGGMSTVGPTTTAETAYTSPSGNVATVQTYTTGFIANITSGNIPARTVGVQEPVWDLYAARGGYTGSMGLPVSDPLNQPNGHVRQSFEGGTVDYDPKTPGSAVLLLPVKAIQLVPAPPGGTLRMNEGDSATLTANAYGPDGSLLTGRTFTWSTTNGRIVSITPNGATATIKAVAGGSASITAASEGATSASFSIFVSAPCCAVGEGAPTPALQQSFADAVTRNKLNPKLPAASPVARAGSGYLQQFQSADTGDVFWIAAAQSTGSAYLLQGALLAAYQNLGGPTGTLGYPLSDASVAGLQKFEGGALAGNPVQLVTGLILAKWALLGYETGSAGSPTGAATPFLTFRATSGTYQAFKNATLFAISSGTQAGKVFAIAGPILAAYAGPASDLGVPTNDEIGLNGLRHQDFEGGYMEYTPGDTVARIVSSPRVPTVSATPLSAPAGSIVRLSLGGFDANAQVRVSITGQPDFLTTVPSGAYIWETYISPAAAGGTVTVKAVDTNSQAAAQSSYTIRSGTNARVSLTSVRGDMQTGLPGAILPIRIQVLYADDSGIPIPNATVRFTPSPGGEISDAGLVTDANGFASANWRLSADDGVALLSVSANAHLLNVSARAAHSGLVNFPAMSQVGNSTPLGSGTDTIGAKGALLVSAAAVIRYFQNRGDLAAPNGLADAAALNAYLKSACGADPVTGTTVCDGFLRPADSGDQIVNLWRLRGFVGGALDVHTVPAMDTVVRDSIAKGYPVILALTLASNGMPAGSHFVVATGVDASGNLALMDPAYGQTSFYGYQYGFQTPAGAPITGTISGAAVLIPQAPATGGFLIASGAQISIQSTSGSCGAAFTFPASNRNYSLQYCDAAAGQVYELDVQAADGASNFQGSFTDLSGVVGKTDFSGSGSSSYAIDRSSGQWTFAPLSVQFQASGVINTASGTPNLAPGGLASIVGTGLASPNSQPTITVNGENAAVTKATPFQLDFQIPPDAVPGQAVLDVVSDALGSAGQTITLLPAAPAIQTAGPRQGFITNQDGTANTRYRPAMRGQSIKVLGTGFGVLAMPGSLATPAHAFIGGVEVAISSLVQPLGSPGVYQLTLLIPANFTPGLSLELLFQQADMTSNVVEVAIQ